MAGTAEGTMSFVEQLPEDMRGDATLQRFNNVGDLAKSYLESRKMIGSSIQVPGEGAAQEDWEKLYNRLGRPESPEKYGLKRPEVQGLEWDEGMEKNFLSSAHKMGLNSRQAQGLLDWYIGLQAKEAEALEVQAKETVETLKKKWGADYGKKAALAQKAIESLAEKMEGGGKTRLKELLYNTSLGNDPLLVEFFALVGENLGEHSFVKGDAVGSTSATDAKTKVTEIMNKPDHPYHRASMTGHDEAVAEVKKLFEIIHTK